MRPLRFPWDSPVCWTANPRRSQRWGSSQSHHRSAAQRCCSDAGPRCRTAYPPRTAASDRCRSGQVPSAAQPAPPTTQGGSEDWAGGLPRSASPGQRLFAAAPQGSGWPRPDVENWHWNSRCGYDRGLPAAPCGRSHSESPTRRYWFVPAAQRLRFLPALHSRTDPACTSGHLPAIFPDCP